MSKPVPVFFTLVLAWSGLAQAQYNADEGDSPLFGGPGDYIYPALCTNCTVWQDYRNFAWNQLSINGGDARTPNNPGHETQFRIYTHPTDDFYPGIVEITVETEDVEFLGQTVLHKPADGDHFIVETHPENGDNVDTGYYPGDMGPLQFPYVAPPTESDSASGGGSSGGSGGGGDSSGGSGGESYGGSSGGTYGGTGGSFFDSGNGNYCGPGTEYRCIQR